MGVGARRAAGADVIGDFAVRLRLRLPLPLPLPLLLRFRMWLDYSCDPLYHLRLRLPLRLRRPLLRLRLRSVRVRRQAARLHVVRSTAIVDQ